MIVEVSLLAGLEVHVDGQPIEVSPRATGLLVRLAAADGPLSRDRLLMDLWGEDVNPSRKRSLETLVSRLRRDVVGPNGITYAAGAYALEVAVHIDALDLIAGKISQTADQVFVSALGSSEWLESLERTTLEALEAERASAPPLGYARIAERHLAYVDQPGRSPAVLLLGGLATHCLIQWQAPGFQSWLRSATGDYRVITLDKRGCGLSDPIDEVPSSADFVSDVIAVLDACAVDCVVVIAAAEAGMFVPHLVAAHPERVAGIAFINAVTKMFQDTEYPVGLPQPVAREFGEDVRDGWGHGAVAGDLSAPSRAKDESFRRWATEHQRAAGTPGSVWHLAQWTAVADARDHLAAIDVPTVVLASRHSKYFRRSAAPWLAERLGHGTVHWLDSADHLYWLAEPERSAASIRSLIASCSAVMSQ